MTTKGSLPFFDLGQVPYLEALALQKKLHQAVVNGRLSSMILCLEHPPVLTFGKNSAPEHLLVSQEELVRRGIELVRVERGGEITAHELGQIVIYPIIDIRAFARSLRQYVFALEEVMIKALSRFGVEAQRLADFPGVWVEAAKVGALGVRVSQRVAYHGFALNVENDLELFRLIRPCGLSFGGVVSLAKLKRDFGQRKDVVEALVAAFSGVFATSCYLAEQAETDDLERFE